MELEQILRDMINGSSSPTRTLSGGLMLQFRQGDESKPQNRLLVYRRGDKPPSTLEFAIVRRDLEAITGTPARLSKDVEYKATDGAWRRGRVFSWIPVPRQGVLL